MATIKLSLQTNSKLELGCVQIEIFSPRDSRSNVWGCVGATRSLQHEVQESDLHLYFQVLLNLLTTSTYSAIFSVLPISPLFSTSSSSIVAVLIAKTEHVCISYR